MPQPFHRAQAHLASRHPGRMNLLEIEGFTALAAYRLTIEMSVARALTELYLAAPGHVTDTKIDILARGFTGPGTMNMANRVQGIIYKIREAFEDVGLNRWAVRRVGKLGYLLAAEDCQPLYDFVVYHT